MWISQILIPVLQPQSACFCFVATPMILEVIQLFIKEKNQQCINPSVTKSATIPRHMHFIAEGEQTKLLGVRLTQE